MFFWRTRCYLAYMFLFGILGAVLEYLVYLVYLVYWLAYLVFGWRTWFDVFRFAYLVSVWRTWYIGWRTWFLCHWDLECELVHLIFSFTKNVQICVYLL